MNHCLRLIAVSVALGASALLPGCGGSGGAPVLTNPAVYAGSYGGPFSGTAAPGGAGTSVSGGVGANVNANGTVDSFVIFSSSDVFNHGTGRVDGAGNVSLSITTYERGLASGPEVYSFTGRIDRSGVTPTVIGTYTDTSGGAIIARGKFSATREG